MTNRESLHATLTASGWREIDTGNRAAVGAWCHVEARRLVEFDRGILRETRCPTARTFWSEVRAVIRRHRDG
jgi:hypothetical protein